MKRDLALETMSFQQQPWTVMDKMRNTMGVESTSWHMHSELRGMHVLVLALDSQICGGSLSPMLIAIQFLSFSKTFYPH